MSTLALAAGAARATPLLLGAAILLSGFAALSYQVAWQRALTQAIGSDSISVVLVVTIFMVWLAVGSFAARLLLRRPRQQVAVVYALVELGIGLYGLVSIPLLRAVNAWFARTGIDSVWADFGLNLLVLAPPIVGMGMTSPLIVQAGRQALGNLGRTVGYLYGLNILGAAVGALACGLVMIEAFGLQGVTWAAGLLNALAAGCALLALRGMSPEPPGGTRVALAARWSRLDVAAVFFGFGTLAMQVIFFRVLHAYLTLSTIVFPVLLCAYLLLMSGGQWVGGQLADRYPSRLPTVCASLVLAGALLLAAALHLPPHWAAQWGVLRFTAFNGSLLANRPELIGDPAVLPALAFALVFMAAVAAWSALFPVLMKMATRSIDDAGGSFGRLYGLYAVGNVIGTFATGIVLLEHLGTGRTAMVTVLLVAAGMLVLLLSRQAVRTAVPAGALVLACAGTAFAIPADVYGRFALDDYRVSDVFEGRVGVATVTPTSRFYSIVDISRTASASALVREPGPADQYEAWRWNHSELMALDPGFRPRRVLVIGIGHAYLPHALLDLPSVQEIVVVDLSPEIVAAVRKHTATGARRVFDDPRVKIVIADGRRYVQSAARRGETFDLVQIKINEPWHAGAGNLFTREFLELTRSVLAPGGYLGVRPLVGHLSDGLQVFGQALYPGYYHLFFRNGPIPQPRRAQVTPDIAAAWSRALPGVNQADPRRPVVLQVMHFTGPDAALRVAANTDDRPTFEYYWLRQRTGSWTSPREHLWDGRFDAYRREIPVDIQAEH